MVERPEEQKDPQTYAIIGAAMEVHRQLGHGFLESVYHEATVIEYTERKISFVSQPVIKIKYKGYTLESYYKPDFICFDEVLVEIKAIARLTTADQAQLINYLKATGLRRGLLINFGAPSLDYKRLVFG